MDQITAAIVAVLPALAAEVVSSGVRDAYEALKAVIRRKWGDAAPICTAITRLEEDPKSKAQAAVLEEEIAAAKATEDADVLQALRLLTEQMKTHDNGGEAVSNIRVVIHSGGSATGIIGATNVSAETLTFAKN